MFCVLLGYIDLQFVFSIQILFFLLLICHFVMLFIFSSTELLNFSFFLVRYIKTNNNLIASKVHLYACFLKLSQLSLSGDQTFLKLEIYDKFIFDL